MLVAVNKNVDISEEEENQKVHLNGCVYIGTTRRAELFSREIIISESINKHLVLVNCASRQFY